MVYILRSQGYPASVEFVPYWATSTGSHYFNSTYSLEGKIIPFDVSTTKVKIDNFSREPSKVIRLMYAKQPNVLASFMETDKIPPGFMRMKNYIDVTPNYWKTTSLTLPIFKLKENQPNIAFVCVLNGLKWRPTWWGKINNGEVTFDNLCKGAVFLPVYYIEEKIVPAAYPIALGYNNSLTLKPDFENKKDIILKEEDKYLRFRANKKYTLFYWNNQWIKHDEKITGINTAELKFHQVPNNALLLLVPEYSEGKERPFIITENQKRVWF